VPLCAPQIPHDLTRARTWAAVMGYRRLTVWAMALLQYQINYCWYSLGGFWDETCRKIDYHIVIYTRPSYSMQRKHETSNQRTVMDTSGSLKQIRVLLCNLSYAFKFLLTASHISYDSRFTQRWLWRGLSSVI
jgi:hypothetical protein